MLTLKNSVKIESMDTKVVNGKAESVEGFPVWLQEQMDLRNWNAADLARRAGVYHSTISRILKGEREAGIDACRAIATALREEPDKVLRLAGLLPEEKGERVLGGFQEELLGLTDQLDEASQRMVLEVVKGLVSRSNR